MPRALCRLSDAVVGLTGSNYLTRHPDRSEAKWRDLFCWCVDKKRSLDYAALRAASLGMTGVYTVIPTGAERSEVKRRDLLF